MEKVRIPFKAKAPGTFGVTEALDAVANFENSKKKDEKSCSHQQKKQRSSG
jgi:hypothetical protein